MKRILHVLHLEDDQLDAELIHARLEVDGVACEVLRVDNREDFVKAVESDTFDFILADFSLPSFDGVSALAIAKEKCPDTPYIFVSGQMGEDVAVDCLKKGATDYLLKTGLTRLPAAVERALKDVEAKKERERAEAELRDLGEKLRALVEDAPVGAYIIQDGEIVYGNRRLYEMHGYTEEEFVREGGDLYRLVHPDDAHLVKEAYEKALPEGGVHCEYRALKKDGTTLWVEVYGTFDVYRGARAQIGTVLDVSERKVLERQKSDFYAMVTHDIKTPLSAIMGNTEFLLTEASDRLDNDVKEMLSSIDRSSARLLGMVEDFLTLSRMEAGKTSLALTITDISSVLNEARMDVESALVERGLSFESDILNDLTPVEIDHRLVVRAVSNMLQNAVKYTPSGGKVTLRTRADKGLISITVSDTGPGIPAGEHDKIFDIYYRSPRTALTNGTGLGLSMVKAVAEAHGGSITLESQEGKGSAFRLTLPI